MPAATAPIGKPSASGSTKKATSQKSSGITRPAGLSRQTATEEEEEVKPVTPAFIGINIAALLMAALFLFTVYSTDQTPKRSSEYLFGEDSDSSGYSASEETEAASGGESSDNEGDDEEEE